MDTISAFIYERILILPGIIMGLSFHEFAHAFASSKCGDPTPKLQGRLSVNPMAHIDPVGFIALLLLGFGWGRPVQIDPRYYKHRRRDEIIVALAGVTMNLLLAIAGMAALRAVYQAGGLLTGGSLGGILVQIIVGIVQINLVLMFFNLIPLPPLDGFGIATQLFKLDTKPWYPRFYQLGPMFLLLLIVLNLTQYILSPAVTFTYGLLANIFF